MTNWTRRMLLVSLFAVGGGGGALLEWAFISKAPTNSPVVVRGGSLGAIGVNGWTIDDAHLSASSNIGNVPNNLYIDGARKLANGSGSEEFAIKGLRNNWEVILTFTNPATTQLHICSYLNNYVCDATGGLSSKAVYLARNSNDKFYKSTADGTHGRVSLKLYQCDTSDHPDPQCNHIDKLTIKGTGSADGDYHCVDGRCDVWIYHK